MSDFMIVELDDRYEFGVPMLDGVLTNADCNNSKSCCDGVDNPRCSNWVDCGVCPTCPPKEE